MLSFRVLYLFGFWVTVFLEYARAEYTEIHSIGLYSTFNTTLAVDTVYNLFTHCNSSSLYTVVFYNMQMALGFFLYCQKKKN